jgi:glucokinase
MKEFIISIDLGGTKILSALINNKKEIISREKVATKFRKGPQQLVKDIVESVHMLFEKSGVGEDKIRAICLGVPGTVNPITGVIGNAPNLEIKNYNIKKALQKHFNIPVLIENDVNLGGLGIKTYEMNDKVNNMLVVFIGTGIGGALFFDGKIYRGSSFFAGEIGHMLVSPEGLLLGTKKKTTFEGIASRTAIVKAILKDIKAGKKSIISELTKDKKAIKSKVLLQAMLKKDKVVQTQINKASKVIGTVLGSLVTLLNIDSIVLGGGVIEAMGKFMLPVIQKEFAKAVLPEPGKIVTITATKLGDDAALFGGLALADEFSAVQNKEEDANE